MPDSAIEILKTDRAPKAIGPYSPGVKAAGFIFTAGQIGILPETGNIVEGGIQAETRQVLQNIEQILIAGNSSLRNIVKTTVFLRDMNEFSQMNEVYAEFFKDNPPARTTVQAAALPKGAAIEIEAIAVTIA